MPNNNVTFCYASETGKQDSFVRIPCSPLYVNDKINAPGQPSLQDIKNLEKKFIEKYPIDSSLTLKDKIYDPLILSTNNESEKEGGNLNFNTKYKDVIDCAWNCAWNEYGTYLDKANAMILSGWIPKKAVGITKKGLGGPEVTKFTSIPSLIQHRHPNFRIKLPSWIGGNSFRFTKNARQTAGILRFAGRIIPGFGWAFLAIDLALIANCTNQCMKNKQPKSNLIS